MIKMQDLGVLGYGGVFTLTNWWDQTRIEKAEITKKEILKKASFWTFLGIGLPATLASAFGWWKRGEPWLEPISHGFMFGAPGFVYDLVQSLRVVTPAAAGTNSEAVRMANEILRRKQATLASNVPIRVLAQGAGMVMPGEVPVTDYEEILA